MARMADHLLLLKPGCVNRDLLIAGILLEKMISYNAAGRINQYEEIWFNENEEEQYRLIQEFSGEDLKQTIVKYPNGESAVFTTARQVFDENGRLIEDTRYEPGTEKNDQ